MNKIRVLVIIEGIREDYMSDMIWQALYNDNDIEFRSNIYPYYFFKNNIKSKKSKVHTLYNKLDSSMIKKNLNKKNLLKTIKNKYYDFIIYPSIRRCNLLFDEVIKIYEINKVIAIDGEDDPCISIKYIDKSIYFKREFLEFYKYKNIKPISFFLPKNILEFVNKYNHNIKKKYLLAPCDPRDITTYIYDQEIDYYKQYSESFFAFTKSKGGWDCLRHYEILASGCLPFFKDIEHKPKYTMMNYPLNLQEQANKIFKRQKENKLFEKDIFLYNLIRNDFFNWQHQESLNYGSKLLRDILKNNKLFKSNQKLNLFNFLELKILNLISILIWSWNQASTSKQLYKKMARCFYFIYLRFIN